MSPGSGFRVEAATLAPRCDHLEAALATLSADGLRVHPSSRIPRYIAAIRRFVEEARRPADYSVEEFHDIAVAILETGEIFYALDLLMREPRVAGWLPIMRKVVKGPYAPTDAADQARDAQFELLAAASCRGAGGEPEFADQTYACAWSVGVFSSQQSVCHR